MATSVGPGTVLTTARAARSDPTACGQESPGTRTRVGAGAGDVGDRAGGAEKRELPGGQRRERGANGVVVDQARQHDPEHEHEETDEHERATHDRPPARRRLGRRPDRRARGRPCGCCVRHDARTIGRPHPLRLRKTGQKGIALS